MKKKIPILILITISSIVFGVYQHLQNRQLKKTIVHQATISQFDSITQRAQAFMEANYGTKFVSGGSSISGMQEYERRVRIPEDKKKEFTEWMNGYSVSPVQLDGFPSSNGSSQETDKGVLLYRVYYGEEPEGW